MVRIDHSTASRLETRRADDESVDDLIQRLLDETAEEVSLESVLEDLLDHYDHVASIRVDHPRPEDPSFITIKVFTADVHKHLDPEQFTRQAPLYNSSKIQLVIEDTEGDARHVVPFNVIESREGPTGEMVDRTPVYRADNFVVAEPLSLTEGIERVREKIGKPIGEIREEMQERWLDDQSDTE